jgi:hypothetical protein
MHGYRGCRANQKDFAIRLFTESEGSRMENRSVGLEEELQGEICAEKREHLLKLINMSLKELWEIAYQLGFEDGMTFAQKD